ncbi:MAG: helix-turn-helix transcriptional regulator [Clostridiales bacterium]|jgi:putative transcriptional regulator
MKNNIHILRAEKRISQDDLAKQLNVSRQTINAIEREKYDPSLALAIKIARLFDKKVEEIFFPD